MNSSGDSQSLENLGNVDDFQDDSCSYEEELEKTEEDRSDATYDVEYPFEAVAKVDIDDDRSCLQLFQKVERDEDQSCLQLFQKVESDASLPTPDDVDPDSLAANSSGEDEHLTVVKGQSAGEERDDTDPEFEPECDFKDKESQYSNCQSVCPSRASVDSQRSICFFVDLEDDNPSVNPMQRSIVQPTRRPALSYRTQSVGDRMTQSMYADPRSSRRSPGGSVSFYVDLNSEHSKSIRPGSFLKSVSREEPDRDLEEVSEDMQVKSQILMEKSLERTQVFFTKLKDYIDYLGKPSYSKDELRQKRMMAENITRLMFEEEENLTSGRLLSESQILDQIVLDGKSEPITKKQQGLKEGKSGKKKNSEEDKPVLRRERTFDMDPKMSIRQMSIPIDSPTSSDQSGETQICQVRRGKKSEEQNSKNSRKDESSSDQNVDSFLKVESRHGQNAESCSGQKDESQCSENDETNSCENVESESAKTPTGDVASLEMFQQQRLLHTKRLKKEILKLEKMESELASVNTKKETHKEPNSRSSQVPPKPQMRQCWTETPKKVTCFKDITKKEEEPMTRSISSASSMSSSWCSWFIPSDEQPGDSSHLAQQTQTRPAGRVGASKGSQTGDSLLRQFRERRDKAVYVRERPQAYFLACEDKLPEKEENKTEQPVAKPRTVGIVRSYKAREEAPVIKTTVIDLETENLPEENNLQEALRRHRPDYIARSKDRERDRMVRSFVGTQRRSMGGNGPAEVLSRSFTSMTPSGLHFQKHLGGHRSAMSESPYINKNSSRSQQPKVPLPSSVKESSNSTTTVQERPTSTTSSTSSKSKSRIPRTTQRPRSQETCQVATSVYGSSQGPRGAGHIARLNEPLQLRGPNTATVYSTHSSEAKQKEVNYKTNRVMATSSGKYPRKTESRTMFKGHSILDSSKVLVR